MPTGKVMAITGGASGIDILFNTEVKERGVHVMMLCPGFTRTNLAIANNLQGPPYYWRIDATSVFLPAAWLQN
jgi:NAD(P)-dependent dehydrogenase (short-subunit alcohol dehydrogenase family)